MPGHERYEELCALSTIGQLPEDEIQELQEHLRVCESCKNREGDFTAILDQLASIAPQGERDSAEAVTRARREEFVRRAQQSGVFLSHVATRGREAVWRRGGKRRSWYKAGFALAACTATAGVVFYVLVPLRQKIATIHQSSFASVSGTPVVSTPKVEVKVVPSLAEVPNPVFAKKVAEDERELKTFRDEVARLERDSEQAKAELELWRGKFGELSTQEEEDKQLLGQARQRLAVLQASETDLTAALVEKQDKIQALTLEVTAEKQATERERELSGAAKDVRELMAARNLHIIDVADVDTHGKAKKSFGRVFYIEGQTLLFYAFDLGQIASPSKVVFQAWGQLEGAGEKPRNLGAFRVDDQEQRRWVLRVSDPNLLASIDSLFVTVEPLPGADQPKGRRLIYAYLNTPANHP